MRRLHETKQWIKISTAMLLAAAALGACSMPASKADLDDTQNAPQSSVSNSSIEQSQSLDSSKQSESGITLSDDMDRTIEIERPQKVTVLIGSFADLLSDAGGKDLISAAAHDTWTSFDLDLDESVVDLGDVKSIAQEALLANNPDLVIASAKNDSQKQMLETLENAGIPVVYYDVDDFDDYMRVLRQFTEITGDESAWKEAGLVQQEKIEAIRKTDRDSSPKVLALRETGKGVKALGSGSSVLGGMLADLKTINIAGDGGLDTLNMEVIARENPEMIFYVAQGKDMETAQAMADELFSSDAWKDLDAVKNKKVYVLDSRLYNLKPNAKWAQALKDLETIVYE